MTGVRIAIVGAGGIGGYFGEKLARAGQDVSFIARGAHLAAMKQAGLTIRDEGTETHLKTPSVHENPGDIGQVDVVLFAVKMTDLEAAARSCAWM